MINVRTRDDVKKAEKGTIRFVLPFVVAVAVGAAVAAMARLLTMNDAVAYVLMVVIMIPVVVWAVRFAFGPFTHHPAGAPAHSRIRF